jgi:hypothetical protein
MRPQGRDGGYEREQDELRRYGLEHDPRADHEYELELADRLADQASLPPGDAAARALARHRLGRGPCTYGQPHEPEPQRFASGELVGHHGPHGRSRPGRVVRTRERDGLVEVDFDHHGNTLVAAAELEREAA